MDFEPIYNKYYVRVNASGGIVDGYSDLFRKPAEGDICINEQGRGHFRLFPDGEENPLLLDGMSMTPLYKWTGEEVVRRSEEEIEADREAWRAEQERIASLPTREDRIEAQVTFTAMMTDTLLEEDEDDV